MVYEKMKETKEAENSYLDMFAGCFCPKQEDFPYPTFFKVISFNFSSKSFSIQFFIECFNIKLSLHGMDLLLTGIDLALDLWFS